MDLIWSILHAGNNFQYHKNTDTYFVLQSAGDGACYTDIVWVFDENGLKQRLMGWSF